MKRFLSMALLGMITAGGLVGCEASAKVGDDDTHGSYQKTTVRREAPTGDTTYEKKTETKTTINP